MERDSGESEWEANRTTFQRIYDVLVGVHSFESADVIAESANCSETAARNALRQLVEMGIAVKRDGRPETYKRNDSYFEWKRIESIVAEYSIEEINSRIQELMDEDRSYQEDYSVPAPELVSSSDLPMDDPAAYESHFDALSHWKTIRRDIGILQRAVTQAESDSNSPLEA